VDDTRRILVVDDDREIRDMVRDYLTEEGFLVSEAGDGETMYRILENEPVDLVILDIRLPGDDGLTLAAELHWKMPVGILMLSSKDELVDKVAGLEVGADDYIVKPFHLRELLARVRSVMRRYDQRIANAAQSSSTDSAANVKVQFGDCQLDLHTRQLVRRAGKPVQLSNGEFELLSAFLEHPRRVLSRDQLMDFARGRHADLYDRSIDVQVGRLRRKLEADPKQPEVIKTVHGAGYMFTLAVQRP
jgi:two-component system OmpR family response regulator